VTETDTAAWEGTLLELFGQLAEGYRTADRPTRRALECEAAEIGETWLLAHVGYPCNDCATPTMQSEYYMVNDAIWRAATKSQRVHFLCIGCLEGRLGRELTAADFTGCQLNTAPEQPRSARLRARLGGGRTS
jgi:hypothetical protein